MRLIALDITLTNTSTRSRTLSLDVLGLDVGADGGSTYAPRFLLAPTPIVLQMHPSGINAGASVAGIVPYEVDDGATGLFLAWRPDHLVPSYRILL